MPGLSEGRLFPVVAKRDPALECHATLGHCSFTLLTPHRYGTVLCYSSLLHRGSFSGEMARKWGKERENREIKKSVSPAHLSFPPPSSPALYSPLPIPQPTGKMKEASAEERGITVELPLSNHPKCQA